MHSDPPSPAAERRLSTRKRAAAREGDGDGDAVFYVDRDSEPRIPLQSKRPRTQMEGKGEGEGEGERRLSTHKRAAMEADSDAAAAVDLDRVSPSPTFRVRLPDSDPPSAEGMLATCKRATATETEADVDLDLGSRTYTEETRNPLRSKRPRVQMEREEKAKLSRACSARMKMVLRPYSAADFETGLKRSEVNPGSCEGPNCTKRKRMEDPPKAKSPRYSKEKDTNRKDKLYCLDDDGMERHNAETDSEERRAGLHNASRKRMVEPPQAKSITQSKEHDTNKKQKLYCLDDDGMERHNADIDSAEQLFVKVGCSHVSLQANMKQTSVNTLVQSAFAKARINTKDFYCTYAGKCLHNKNLLSCYPLQRDSVIKVQHRLRAGMLQTFDYPDWNNVILGVNRFHRITLPNQLRDMRRNITSALFLSEQIQHYASEALAALCRLFLRDDTLNGNFNSTHILYRDGHFIFADTVQRHQFTAVGARLDLQRICGVFQPVFQTGNPQDVVLYVNHLLHFLNACPVGVDLRSEAVLTFLCNHFALQDYSEKIDTCHKLRAMIERLVGPAETRFMNSIAGVPNFGPAWAVPTLRAVYTFKASLHPVTRRIMRVRYSRDGASFVRLGSNFFKHARTIANFPLELLEAAFSATMSQGDFLVNLLQRIAVLPQPLPYPEFDVVKMLGKKVQL